MNQPSQILFLLIQTLIPSEKKLFVQYLKMQGKKNHDTQALILFQYLRKQMEFNQSQAIEELKSKIPQKSFVVVKNHLTTKLKYFLSVTQFKSLRSQIHLHLLEIEMLFNRQLFHEAEATCNKVIELSKKAGITQTIVEACSWKFILLPYTTQRNYTLKFQEIMAGYNRAIKNLEIGGKMREFQETILAKSMQNFDLHNLDEIKKVEMLLNQFTVEIGDNMKVLSDENRLMYETIRVLIFRVLGRYEEAFKAQQITLDIILANKELYIKTKRNDFIAIICNYFAVVSLTNHFEDFKQHLEYTKNLLNNEFKGNSKIKNTYILNEFLFHILTKKEQIRKSIFNDFENYYFANREKLSADTRSVFSIAYCLGTYETEFYEKGMEAMQYELNLHRRNGVREDQLVDFHISYFISYFLLLISKRWNPKEFHAFSVSLEPSYNIYRKKPKEHDYHFERCIISLFRKLKPTVTRKEMLRQVIITEKKFNQIFETPTPSTAAVSVNFNHTEFIERCKTYLSC